MTDDLYKRYAVIIAYSPTIGTDKVNIEIVDFQNMVKNLNGKTEKAEYLGLKSLAYEIKKQNSAHYVQFYINMEINQNLKKNLEKIDKSCNNKINDRILRHMIIKIEHKDFNFKTL